MVGRTAAPGCGDGGQEAWAGGAPTVSGWVSDALTGYTDWPHLAQACRTERTVTQQGKTTVEVAYAVTSLPPGGASPERLLALWRTS